ncbi:MAG: putative bacterial DnaA helix-turn-helix protein [Prokaryotic dsDNA virus sp.]|nr:MAG: putative bacterial DnaA helix-turn-helix protein [Prokaryotic dsDNA virus sp.]|tara:strand:- start:4866 stop:5261 length:396 start_codon:yes stop_codon:yes gene_type:complete
MSIQIIKEVVEQHFDIDITKDTRKREYVEARAMYFNLARDYTRMSLSVIGKTVYRDHTTVLYFLKQLRDWMLHDYRLKQDYDTINKRVQDAIHANPEEFKTAVTIEGFYETQYKRLKELTEQINKDQLVID